MSESTHKVVEATIPGRPAVMIIVGSEEGKEWAASYLGSLPEVTRVIAYDYQVPQLGPTIDQMILDDNRELAVMVARSIYRKGQGWFTTNPLFDKAKSVLDRILEYGVK